MALLAPDRAVPATTVAWSSREWDAISSIARREGVTPEAVVRAFVQRGLSSPGEPVKPTRRGVGVALVVTDGEGRRLCPDCRGPLVKKNPNGPGRYPARCEGCQGA